MSAKERIALFRSFQKEQKSAKRVNCSFALFFALFSKKKGIRSFPKRAIYSIINSMVAQHAAHVRGPGVVFI